MAKKIQPVMGLTIDPSIKSAGLAWWLLKRTPKRGETWRLWHRHARPWHTELVKVRGGADWDLRANEMSKQITRLAGRHGLPEVVAIECPMFFASAGGTMVASQQSLTKLTWGAALLAGRFLEMGGIDILPVTVREWKGQLPKKVVNARIAKLLGADACVDFKHDVWDAVGIGLHMAGRL